MKEIQLTIKALSPLAIGRQKPGGSISEAQEYIPGSVIRGAVASQMLRQSPQSGDQPGGDFQALFVDEGAAVFSNAYPTGAGVRSQVPPATAVSSKTFPGFKGEKPDNGGVFDTLIDSFCAEGHGHLYDPNCPKDGGRLEPFGGFYSLEGNQYRSHSVATRLLTKVGINRRRATAQEQVLYSVQVINETQKKGREDTLFSGTIRLENAELAQVLAEYLTSSRLRLGGSTSRGLGKVKIQAEVSDYQSETERRVNAFNQVLRDRWQTWGNLFDSPQSPLPETCKFFTLDLQSEAILSEQWRRTTVISPAMLRQMAGVDDPDLALQATYSSYDYRSGWNAAWGLMKDVELVTTKGAVYLFSTPNLEAWLPALAALERRGVGERTPEGFGQVQVCSEFHHVFREEAA
ncbi:MAG: CRISPR-associated RAMP protein Csx10 [Shackletoniella antarctica]|uniref:CRISPR-associated RAMP protein Csx10 n=1 Tax=Shackletoniella antarctica TaxID=268115 RepID=A0A2W4XK59_9CYAN|nr:MAG: CRISPR-associated RAMP protein Csx10 [Shackletoniella antarctica]